MSATSTELLKAIVEGPVTLDGPTWLNDRRQHALHKLKQEGLPSVKDEAWRFTSVKAIAQKAFAHTPPSHPSIDLDAIHRRLDERIGDAPRLLIVNGIPQLQELRLPTGLVLQSLQDMPDNTARSARDLATISPNQHFVALNTAMFKAALLLEVQPQHRIREPLHLVYLNHRSSPLQATYPRLFLRVGEHSQLSLVEHELSDLGVDSKTPNSESTTLNNAVSEIILAEGAELQHIRAVEPNQQNYSIAAIDVQQEKSSTYTHHAFSFGGPLTRSDLRIALNAPGAQCDVRALYLANQNELVDHHTHITHSAAHTSSRKNYRGIAGAQGKVIFDGIAVIDAGADHCSAHQHNRNLMLADNAVVHSKPHLEINTDEVQCSHGSTIGALDENQVFYLRSRGIPEATARNMLTHAFAQAHLDAITQPKLHHALTERVHSMLDAQGKQVR